MQVAVNRLCSWLVLGALMATSARAIADDAPPPAAEPIEVRVIGDKADALQKIPGSGTLVTKKDIERADPYDVAEMLRRVPGLNVRQDEGAGLRLDIGVRGLDPGRARHVLVLEDGVPVAINPYAEPDLYYSPPIERMRGIEVVKGSGSILFGPQTIGGVINFLTLTPPSGREATLAVDGGQRAYVKGLANYGDSFGRARYVLQVFHKRGAGFAGAAFNGTDVFGKVSIDTSERGELTLKLGFHDQGSVSTDVGLTPSMFAKNPRRLVLAPDDKTALRRYDVALIHEHGFSEVTKLRTLAYAYTTSRIWNRQEWTRNPDPLAFYDHIAGDQRIPQGAIYFKDTDIILDRSYDVFGVEPRMTHTFTTGSITHTLDFGARFLTETAHVQQAAGDSPDATAGTVGLDEKHRTYAFAGYLQDRIAFTSKLLVTPGFRLEHRRFRRQILTAKKGEEPTDDTETTPIPGIGIVYGSPFLHGFGGLHVGYSPPRLTDTVDSEGHPEELEAERAIHYEIGARLALRRMLRIEMTCFLSSFQNQVITGIDSESGRTEHFNGGQTRSLGIEHAALVGFGDMFKIGMAIDLSGQYTFSRATFLDSSHAGKLLPYAPQHTASATLSVEHPIGAGAEVTWRHVSAQFADDLNTTTEDATGVTGLIPAYNIVDIGVRYRHKRTGLMASVTVKGLLDNIYISSRRPEGIHAAGFRQIMAGLRWNYRAAR